MVVPDYTHASTRTSIKESKDIEKDVALIPVVVKVLESISRENDMVKKALLLF
jgi:hypothetical protein